MVFTAVVALCFSTREVQLFVSCVVTSRTCFFSFVIIFQHVSVMTELFAAHRCFLVFLNVSIACYPAMSGYISGSCSLNMNNRRVNVKFLVLIQVAICTSSKLNYFFRLFAVFYNFRCLRIWM